MSLLANASDRVSVLTSLVTGVPAEPKILAEPCKEPSDDEPRELMAHGNLAHMREMHLPGTCSEVPPLPEHLLARLASLLTLTL